jgi:hypothetical protein
MDAEAEKKCDEQLAALTSMYREKQLEANLYYKCLVALAYEFSIGDKHLRAATLAQGIPLEYFRDVQRQQMQEDPNYAYVAYTLALNLLQQGFVHIGAGPTLSPTMAPASA